MTSFKVTMLCHKLLFIASLKYIAKKKNLLKASHLWDSVLGNEGTVCLTEQNSGDILEKWLSESVTWPILHCKDGDTPKA